MKKYKVLSQKDKWFSGRMDPVFLETALNELAADGWRVLAMTSASREGLLTGGGKDELLVLLEKDVASPARVRSEPDEDGVYRL
jgi:hypothetical protein